MRQLLVALRDIGVVLTGVSFRESHCCFSRQLGINFLSQIQKRHYFRGCGYIIFWGWRDYFLRWDKPWESEGSKFSASVRSFHTSPSQVTGGAHSLPVNALILTADTLQGWGLNFRCNSHKLILRPLVWFSTIWALAAGEKILFHSTLRNL